jgi:hypothetical protein
MNEQLRAGGASNVRVVMAELLVAPGAGEELSVLRSDCALGIDLHPRRNIYVRIPGQGR